MVKMPKETIARIRSTLIPALKNRLYATISTIRRKGKDNE